MDEHEEEMRASGTADRLFRVYLALNLNQRKSVASTVATTGVYQGQDAEVRQFLELGDLPPAEKLRLFEMIREDAAHM
jgi:hypothetical protein